MKLSCGHHDDNDDDRCRNVQSSLNISVSVQGPENSRDVHAELSRKEKCPEVFISEKGLI